MNPHRPFHQRALSMETRMSKILALVLGLMLALPFGVGVASAAGANWAAIAAGNGYLNNGAPYTRAGVGYGSTKAGAEAEALKACGRNACLIQVVHNYGCAFVVTGYNGFGQVNWATGRSEQEAIWNLRATGMTALYGPPIGGCFR